MNEQIVVYDPKGEYWEGALVENFVAEAVKRRGGGALPVCAELFKSGAIGGYFKRAWGSGWKLNDAVSSLVCPMMLYVAPGKMNLDWCARVAPSDPAIPLGGQLRLVADTSQRAAFGGGLSYGVDTAIALGPNLGPPDAAGGWTVHGKASINVQHEGFHGFALYGASRNAKLLWAAISQT